MNQRRTALVPLAASILLALSSTPSDAQPARPAPIWRGESAGFSVMWTDGDIRAVRSADRRVAWSFAREVSADSVGEGCEWEESGRVLSLVGPYLSYERATGWTCPGIMHPGAYALWRAVDLRSPRRPVRLTDIFPPREVLAALLADPLVRATLDSSRVTRPPASIDSLVAVLARATYVCEYEFPDDVLTRFSFHHVEGGRVAVRIGLPHGCELERGRLTQVGILLPIPPSLANALAAAADGREGVLQKDADAIGKRRSAYLDRMGPRKRH